MPLATSGRVNNRCKVTSRKTPHSIHANEKRVDEVGDNSSFRYSSRAAVVHERAACVSKLPAIVNTTSTGSAMRLAKSDAWSLSVTSRNTRASNSSTVLHTVPRSCRGEREDHMCS